MRDRRVIAVVAAGAITVVALLVIVVLGVRPLPDFSALAGSNETGFVAYAVDEGGHQMSAHIVDLSTAETIEVNLPDNGEVAGWDDDGNLMLVQWGSTVRIKHLDPVTGEQVGTTERIQEYAGPDRDDVWISPTTAATSCWNVRTARRRHSRRPRRTTSRPRHPWVTTEWRSSTRWAGSRFARQART